MMMSTDGRGFRFEYAGHSLHSPSRLGRLALDLLPALLPLLSRDHFVLSIGRDLLGCYESLLSSTSFESPNLPSLRHRFSLERISRFSEYGYPLDVDAHLLKVLIFEAKENATGETRRSDECRDVLREQGMQREGGG